MKLNEGMRSGDLEDLVLPLITIDEYESKVDDDAIVVGFYVNDHDAANDLNRFIQKSPVMILDTDVSPAPDQRGYYLVFFEVLKNDRLAENVTDMLAEVGPLAHIEAWQMRIRGRDGVEDANEDVIAKHFAKKDDDEDKSEVAEAAMAFLRASDIERITHRDGMLVLEGYGYRNAYEIIGFDSLDRIMSEQSFSVSADDIGFAAAVESMKMDRLLGEGWSVSKLKGMSLLSHSSSTDALLLRLK